MLKKTIGIVFAAAAVAAMVYAVMGRGTYSSAIVSPSKPTPQPTPQVVVPEQQQIVVEELTPTDVVDTLVQVAQ